ncbi:exocyst complex component 6B-like [Diaphorina citri]|uniref:Exocyst complex component 6B-like n=1 Tax=Diaphorina citri TaxID=121845 RepID=A0A3Q0JAM3_DIACI|nr:exocyst complex component 6B-like [Diaphorina citri]
MHENIASYKSYVHSVVGFFVVEDHVLNTTENLISRAYLDQHWEAALGKISNALRTQSAYCTDATLLLHIKDLIMLFITTLRMSSTYLNHCNTLANKGFFVLKIFSSI